MASSRGSSTFGGQSRYTADNREQNELLYSMRSVKASMGDVVKTNHLVLYDFPFNAAEGDLRLLDEASIHYLQRSLNNQKTLGNVLDHLKNEWRVAQTPNWLDFSKINQQSSRLRYAGHSEIYHLPTVGRDHEPLDAGEHAWLEREWKKYALPTYNSMAIESRLGFLPGLSDAAVAFEDDYFLLRPLAVSYPQTLLTQGFRLSFASIWHHSAVQAW